MILKCLLPLKDTAQAISSLTRILGVSHSHRLQRSIMSNGGVQDQKRKRSESMNSEEAHWHRSSPPPYHQLSLSHHEEPVVEYLSAPPSTSGLELGPTPTGTVLPLTKANLSILDPTMEAKSSTPSKQARDDTSVASSENVAAAMRLLEQHHYHVADKHVQAQNRNFINQATERVIEDRNSPMKPEQLRVIEESYDAARNRNEATFLAMFWPNLITWSRTVKQGESWENLPRTPQNWISDSILANYDQDFRKDSVDEIKPVNNFERKLLDALPKISNPKPDMVYGLIPGRWCSSEEIAAIHCFGRHSMPSRDLVLPSFLVEGKSIDGNIEVAEVQAMRGGAALNASFRRLDKEAGTAFEGDGPDERSMVYSLIFGPMYARLNIHWSQIEAGEQIAYYTHRLKKYDMSDVEAWKDIRSAVHNILDWTAFERKDMVKKILGAIVEKDRKTDSAQDGGRAAKKQKTDDREASASSNSSKAK